MYRVAAIALVLFASTAEAAPVYLHCQLDPGAKAGGDPEMNVTLNEETETVTYSAPTIGRAFTVHGVFAADHVTFNGFTIDRTNLAFQRDMSDLQVEGPPIIDHGKCTLVKVNRAF
jgi:hypothetical protein